MKDGIPSIYWLFRYGWSVLHLSILGFAAVALIIWAFTDHQGADAIGGWLGWINNLRRTLSNLLPFPWG